jgi:hypothetical protein
MKFCPIVPEICCGQVHVPKKERNEPFSKWLPQYHTNSTLSDFNDISYVGRL